MESLTSAKYMDAVRLSMPDQNFKSQMNSKQDKKSLKLRKHDLESALLASASLHHNSTTSAHRNKYQLGSTLQKSQQHGIRPHAETAMGLYGGHNDSMKDTTLERSHSTSQHSNLGI